MQERDIKDAIAGEYRVASWREVLRAVFPDVRFEQTPSLVADNSGKTTSILQLGDITLSDGKRIIILEAHVRPEHIIAQNRVGFNNLVAKYIDQAANHGLLVFYLSEDPFQLVYRLSLICRETRFNDDGRVELVKTHPKRYTYLLGGEETGSTAAKRLKELSAKKDDLSFELADVIDAFSVEKLTKEFFDKYKESYRRFNNFLREEPAIRNDIFGLITDATAKETEDERPIRDFTKKLLGRIVFLYFLQRKGWMGVPAPTNDKEVVWKGGKQDFVHRLFLECSLPDRFHSKYLNILFYHTLNNNRKPAFLFQVDGESPFADGENVSVPFLNGGLFDDDFSLGNSIDFPAEYFESLFSFLNQYNFTIDENSPEDHEVGIDPEMLGHIFENLLEDNRDKGAYYTPKKVVHYMSQQSLIHYLHGALGEGYEEIRRFVKTRERSAYVQQHRDTIERLLQGVKICDPAIGSGAFPMGALRVIFNSLQCLHDWSSSKVPFDPVKAKKNIIQNCIHGVDLEKGAVDIARLRFWLSLVVDEDEPQPLPNLDYKIMQGNSLLERFEDIDLSAIAKEDDEEDDDIILTSTGGQIEIGATFSRKKQPVIVFEKHTRQELIDLIRAFFDFDTNPIPAYATKQEIRDRINAIVDGYLRACLHKEQEHCNADLFSAERARMGNAIRPTDSPALRRKKEKLIERNTKDMEGLTARLARLGEVLEQLTAWEDEGRNRPYFLWHTYFKDVLDAGGFHIVIGNPPYIKEFTNRQAFDGLHNSPYYMGKMDIWYFFACAGLDLLRNEGGIQCFIAQSNWITSAGAAKLREAVLTRTTMLSFVDFGNYKVFQSAGIQTMIYVLRTGTPPPVYEVEYSRLLVDNIDKEFLGVFLEGSPSPNGEYVHQRIELVPERILGGYISFNENDLETILNKMGDRGNLRLLENEIAQGIVPNPDRVNSRNIKSVSEHLLLSKKVQVDDGVFVVDKGKFDALPSKERRYIKPIFEPREVSKYKFVEDYEKEILYITKKNYEDDAPNLLAYLEPYREIMDARRENQNGRLDFFHLHWPRDEYFFEGGPKILAVRKCATPTFIYTEEAAYVMMAFNIIKTERISPKYLTALLNSKVIAFWLRYKGKMQGNIYQVDKEPLMDIPIALSPHTHIFETLVDYILFVHRPHPAQLIKYIDDELIIRTLEDIIDAAVLETYFPDEIAAAGLQVLPHLESLRPVGNLPTEVAAKTIAAFYHEVNEQRNPIRTAFLKANIVSKDLVAVINAHIA